MEATSYLLHGLNAGWIVRALAVALLVAATTGSGSAATSAQVCEAGKNGTAGKYASCLMKAQAKFVKGGEVDNAGYGTALGKCGQTFDDKWLALETKAAGMCPSTGDESSIQDFLDACIFAAEEALGGGTLPSDVVTCNDDLATCEGDLAACEADRGVLQTGQTTAYGAGSDGALELGVTRSFTDNGDGTITDNATGLMWEKKSNNDGSIHNVESFYTWSTGTNSMDGTLATVFLANLNSGGGFAGYTDWRIPNRNELLSIVDLEGGTRATFTHFNADCTFGCSVTTCSCTQALPTWTSSTDKNDPSGAWVVGFGSGYSNVDPKTDQNYARAVRGGY